jgi:hypothetical protein
VAGKGANAPIIDNKISETAQASLTVDNSILDNENNTIENTTYIANENESESSELTTLADRDAREGRTRIRAVDNRATDQQKIERRRQRPCSLDVFKTPCSRRRTHCNKAISHAEESLTPDQRELIGRRQKIIGMMGLEVPD